MKSQDLKKYNLPMAPGVYFFVGSKGKILYIGKATSLNSRVKSYFNKDISKSRGPIITRMLEEAKSVDFKESDSVLEALILEAVLIKKHKPKYNTKEKDDKSHNYIVITDEDFPRVLLVRGRELLGTPSTKWEVKYFFGPFPRGSILKDALKIIRKIFPFRDKCTPGAGKPCFNNQIGLCPGVCTGEISEKDYRKIISNLKLFLEGKKVTLIKKLEREMRALAKKQEFEKASKIKKTIFALKHIQDIALIKNNYETDKILKDRGRTSIIRIEGYDVAHISGTNMVGVMVALEDGEPQKNEYRKFKIKGVSGVSDTASLSEVLERRFGHPEWQYPRLIVVDGGKAQKNAAEKVLKKLGIEIPVLSVVKNERHKPKGILGTKDLIKKYEKEILFASSESHRFALSYHRQKREVLVKKI